MRKLFVIGIGTGDPDHVTVQAIKAMNRADVVFLLDKGDEKAELSRVRREICERYIEQQAYRTVQIEDRPRDEQISGYVERVEEWHERRLAAYEQKVEEELAVDGTGVILVWGDPSLYDSTLRILERMQERARVEFEYEVIPGISAPQVLAARHKITLNQIGGAVHLTTGRRLASTPAACARDVLVMLDGACAFNQIPDSDLDIYYGAYLGMPGELLVRGPLGERKAEIERARSAARTERGWIMDTYLLRRRSVG